MSAPYDARSVANLILDFGDETSVILTQISLLKILYFAHGWYLARTGGPLVQQDFEAWKYGPVVKVVRDSFKENVDRPIMTRARKLNIYENRYEDLTEVLSQKDRKHVWDIFRTYSVHNAWSLSEMTHERGSPWDLVWNSEKPIGRLGMRIRNEDIRRHFVARLGGSAIL